MANKILKANGGVNVVIRLHETNIQDRYNVDFIFLREGAEFAKQSVNLVKADELLELADFIQSHIQPATDEPYGYEVRD